MTETTKQHEQDIVCPECRTPQKAIVEHTRPWWSYIHTCETCGYIILESEWEEVKVEDG